LLLQKGAKPDLKSRNGSTALMFAAKNGQSGVVKQLLAAGASVNTSDSEGITALMHAVYGGYPDIVDQLVKSGAKTDHADRHGTTPRALALKKNDKNVLVMLTRDAGAKK